MALTPKQRQELTERAIIHLDKNGKETVCGKKITTKTRTTHCFLNTNCEDCFHAS